MGVGGAYVISIVCWLLDVIWLFAHGMAWYDRIMLMRVRYL